MTRAETKAVLVAKWVPKLDNSGSSRSMTQAGASDGTAEVAAWRIELTILAEGGAT